MAEAEDNGAQYIEGVRQLQQQFREMRRSRKTFIAQAFSTVKREDAIHGMKDLWLEVQIDEAMRYKLLLDYFQYDIDKWEFLDASAEQQFFGDSTFNAVLMSYAYAYYAKKAVKQALQAAAEKNDPGSPVYVCRKCINAIVEAWEVFTEGFCFSLAQNVHQHSPGLPEGLYDTVHKVLISWVGSRTSFPPTRDTLDEMPGEVASRTPNLECYEDFKRLPGSIDWRLRRLPMMTNGRELRIVSETEECEYSFIEDSAQPLTDGIEEFEAKEIILNTAGLTKAQMQTLCFHRAGYLYAEIAAIMGVDEGTVGQHLSRARKKIKKHLMGK